MLSDLGEAFPSKTNPIVAWKPESISGFVYEKNDHEVRFLAAGEDLIGVFWNDMMGLDPDDILVEPCLLHSEAKPHRATIARCNCGVIGCGSIDVEVKQSQGIVDWTWGREGSRQTISFLGATYDAEIERALSDTS